jgi:hypothetical protein
MVSSSLLRPHLPKLLLWDLISNICIQTIAWCLTVPIPKPQFLKLDQFDSKWLVTFDAVTLGIGVFVKSLQDQEPPRSLQSKILWHSQLFITAKWYQVKISKGKRIMEKLYTSLQVSSLTGVAQKHLILPVFLTRACLTAISTTNLSYSDSSPPKRKSIQFE